MLPRAASVASGKVRAPPRVRLRLPQRTPAKSSIKTSNELRFRPRNSCVLQICQPREKISPVDDVVTLHPTVTAEYFHNLLQSLGWVPHDNAEASKIAAKSIEQAL